jgi:hypothetical protein
MIEAYLEELERELHARGAPRRRFLAEARDHLTAAAQELGDEHAAVQRFGDAATVAGRFAEAAVETRARRSLTMLLLAFGTYIAAAVAFAATAGPEFADFPQGAPSQVALVAAGAALVVGRVRRSRRVTAAAAGAAVLAGGATLELTASLTRPAGILPWQELALVAALFAVALLASLLAAALTGITAIHWKKVQRTS